MSDTPEALLRSWLEQRLDATGQAWLADRLETIRDDNGDRALHIALGLAPRKLGRADLNLGPDDLEKAEAVRPGWDPSEWSIDQATRILMLLTAGTDDPDFPKRFSKLCRTADAAEAIAFYRGLPLYGNQAALEAQAAEGLRTNMRAVFEAVAHRNPFPREQFDESRWNHMVLKALFVDSTLAPIQGLDARANAELAIILSDYAHERWAAGRPVTPELWRCIGPFAEGRLVDDLERAARDGGPAERDAAGLALAASSDPRAKAVLDGMPTVAARIADGTTTWTTLGSAD